MSKFTLQLWVILFYNKQVKTTIKQRIPTEVRGIKFCYKSGMLFIKLPSGRMLSYVKPKIGENKFGGESVTYEGVGATKKWERIESYGPKFVENIVQAVSRDLLCYAMHNLSDQQICGHVHDELIIECLENVSVESITSVIPDMMCIVRNKSNIIFIRNDNCKIPSIN